MSQSTTEIRSVKKRISMQPSDIVIQRTPVGSLRTSMGGGLTMRRTNVSNVYSAPSIVRPQGEAGRASKEAVQNVMGTRGKEKKEISDLNVKLADYIEKARYNDACNRALTEEVERLRKMKGYTQERVRAEYEDELKEARDTIKDLEKKMAPLHAKINELEDQVDSKDAELEALRKRIDDLLAERDRSNQIIADHEGEMAALRKALEAAESKNEMLRQDIQRCREDNDRIRMDCETAVAKQIAAEQEVECLNEELEFERKTSEIEITELKELLKNFQGVQPKIEQMWKSEYKSMVNDIQKGFNEQLDALTAEQQRRYDEQLRQAMANIKPDSTDAIVKSENKTLKTQMGDYKSKLSDLERENTRLKDELERLRREWEKDCQECEEEKNALRQEITDKSYELEEVLKSLNALQDSKLDLEVEIQLYRRLLDQEENKMKSAIERQGNMQSIGGSMLAETISGGLSGSGGGSMSMSQSSSMSESSGKVVISRASSVPIIVQEIDSMGRFITLSNNSSSKEFDLSNWTLERSAGKGKATFKFPANCKVAPKKTLKIYSFNWEDERGVNDLIGTRDSCKVWGSGDGRVSLIDDRGAEKAYATVKHQSM